MRKLKGSYMKPYGLDQILHPHLSEENENCQKCVVTAQYSRNKISINFGIFECNNYEKYCILRYAAM
jgi:hypothetical protein